MLSFIKEDNFEFLDFIHFPRLKTSSQYVDLKISSIIQNIYRVSGTAASNIIGKNESVKK